MSIDHADGSDARADLIASTVSEIARTKNAQSEDESMASDARDSFWRVRKPTEEKTESYFESMYESDPA